MNKIYSNQCLYSYCLDVNHDRDKVLFGLEKEIIDEVNSTIIPPPQWKKTKS